jgi:hypothetical protein
MDQMNRFSALETRWPQPVMPVPQHRGDKLQRESIKTNGFRVALCLPGMTAWLHARMITLVPAGKEIKKDRNNAKISHRARHLDFRSFFLAGVCRRAGNNGRMCAENP